MCTEQFGVQRLHTRIRSLLLVVRPSVLRGSRHVRVPVLVVVVLVLSFMEQCGDEVKNAILHVSSSSQPVVRVACQDLRADDSRDESTPWQAAVLAARNRLTSRAETSSIFFTARSTGTTIRSGKNAPTKQRSRNINVQRMSLGLCSRTQLRIMAIRV
jgi:hypothetical protein